MGVKGGRGLRSDNGRIKRGELKVRHHCTRMRGLDGGGRRGLAGNGWKRPAARGIRRSRSGQRLGTALTAGPHLAAANAKRKGEGAVLGRRSEDVGPLGPVACAGKKREKGQPAWGLRGLG
jgi:hypothetical protein